MTTVTAPPSAQLEEIVKSGEDIAAFLSYQDEWHVRAHEALNHDYFLETISICIHQLHALLRRALWVNAQNQSLDEHPRLWKNEYLFSLLLRGSDALMDDAPDMQLYTAAERFGILSTQSAEHLRTLFRDMHTTQRALLSGEHGNMPHKRIRNIAIELLRLDRDCLTTLKQSFVRFESRIEALLKY